MSPGNYISTIIPDPYTPLRVATDYLHNGQMPTLFVTGVCFF